MTVPLGHAPQASAADVHPYLHGSSGRSRTGSKPEPNRNLWVVLESKKLDMEKQLREAYGDIVLEIVRDDVKVPVAYTAGQPVTLYSPTASAAEAYTKIGRQMKLYR